MAQGKTERELLLAGAQELGGKTEYKFVRKLPNTIDALAEKRLNKEKRILSPGEVIPLDERQDLLRRIFEINHKPIGETEHIDVYNPAIIVLPGGEVEFLGRAEGRKTPFSTLVLHFQFVDGHPIPRDKFALPLEDPAIAKIGDEIVVAGVKLDRNLTTASADYKTDIYAGKSLGDLEKLEEEGPRGMKDVRFAQLKVLTNGVGVYTRPHTVAGGLEGQIGFTTIDSLTDLTAKVIQDAPLINARFPEGEWGGLNQAQELPDGRVIGLGHRAYRDEKKERHYFPWAIIHDPVTGEIIDLGILAESSDFPPGVAKAWDLRDVLFSAGFILDLKENKLTLYVGTRDTGVGKIVIDNFRIPPKNSHQWKNS